MSKSLFIKNKIEINAPAKKVWNALVNPEQTKKYMFGCETVSDWKPGSPLLWRGNYEGVEIVFVKGIIEDIQPGELLTYTTIDPNNSAIEDIPENYLTVTYALETKDDTMLPSLLLQPFAENAIKHGIEKLNSKGKILVEIKKLVEAK